ncbi:hypothetical protein FRC03_002023 [Tulasnella sp. 419]|nr:hypothetical protein FRC02_003316 [Tulasnella sp. 418]KAG8964256.1 hypothetical protein FRC03_002023 [Tulasnella sp. 419]
MASSGPSGSLRGSYAPSNDSWTFLNTSPVPGGSSSSQPLTSGSPKWSRTTKSHVFDLAPAVHYDTDFGLGRLVGERDERDWGKVFSDAMAAGLLQYASTALVMPFEVAKILLQVQWIPREDVEFEAPEVDAEVPENTTDDDAMSDASSSSYFHDPSASPRSGLVQKTTFADEQAAHEHAVDDSRPSYIIPTGPSDGVTGMMRRVGTWKTEGYLALWKGQLTTTFLELLTNSVQPAVQSFLYSFQNVSDPVPPPHSLLTLITPVVSHAFTAHLLSPLDLLRTRLIVQPSPNTPLNLPVSLFPSTPLIHLLAQEGGLYTTYFHPDLLIPSLLDNTIRPLLALSAPIVIRHYTGLDEESSPILYSLLELSWSIASLVVTLPIETVRRRLQVQSRATKLAGGGLERTVACVETRPVPYAGFLDCLWKIISEERSMPTRRRRRRSSAAREALNKPPKTRRWSLIQDTGIGQLYRGFNTAVSANVIVFILGAVAGERMGQDAGWTEL